MAACSGRPTASGTLSTARQRLVIPIVDPSDANAGAVDAGLRPTGPLRLDAIEISLDVADEVMVIGSIDLLSVEGSPSAGGRSGLGGGASRSRDTRLGLAPDRPGSTT